MKVPRRLHATAYSYFIEALLLGNMSKRQLESISGLGGNLAGRLIAALRARGHDAEKPGFNRVLHISAWQADQRGHVTIKAYRLGPGFDAPQPKKPRAEIVRDWKERHLKKKEQHS